MQKILLFSFLCFIACCKPSDTQLDNNISEYARIMQLKVLAYSCNGPSNELIGCVRCDIKTDEGLMPLTCCDDFCRSASTIHPRH